MWRFRTPLTWKNLTHDRRRLATAVGGIAFAVILMFMQKGFENALIDSTAEVLHRLDGDILIASRAQYALPAQQRFELKNITRARGVAGVASVSPLYIETFAAEFKSAGNKGYPIRVLGVDLDDPVLDFPEIERHHNELAGRGTAIIDVKSKAKYELQFAGPSTLNEKPIELTDKSLRLVGTFQLGTDFYNDGNLIMSRENFARYFPFRVPGGDPLTQVDLGVVRIDPGADLSKVQARLEKRLGDDVFVYTKDEFIANETHFWRTSTPTGFVFGFGTIMGFAVGVIICYQIIYANIADHMGEFATLKAMGYTSAYFVSMVVCESLYLSILGFLPGWIIALILYNLLAVQTGLLLNMTWWLCGMIYLLTLAMCVVSGVLALRKVLAADPAELF